MVAVQVEVAPTYLAKRDILEDNTGSMHKVRDVFAGSSLYYVRLSPPSPQKAPFMRLMRGIILMPWCSWWAPWNQSYESQTAQLCRNVGRSGRRINSLEKS